MNEVDGRVIAVGILAGLVLGFIVFLLTTNIVFIYLGAGLGLILALGVNNRKGGG